MSKKGENIHKRKDGRWEGRYKKGRDIDGRIIYGSVYGKTYREVKDKIISTIVADETVSLAKGKDRNFCEVLNMWMENNRIRYKGATENKYQYLIDTHIMPELGNVKLSQLTAPRVNAFLRQKMESGRINDYGGLSPSYVRSIMLIINAALKFAQDEQMCIPLKTPIYKPPVGKNEIPILNLEQQKKLEEYLISNLDFTNIGILVSLHTGLRIGEICALSWEDIDFKNHIIHVRHTIARVINHSSQDNSFSKLILDTPKTTASLRDIPISSKLLPLLKQMKNRTKSDFVVSDGNGFVSTRTYDYRYHSVLKKCGIPSVNYHALRHTFATRCIEAGVDVKSLSEILGHANVGITLNTYVHSSMELKRNQLEKLTIAFASF